MLTCLVRRFRSPVTSWAATILAGILFLPFVLLSAGVIPAVRFTRERIEVTVHPEAIGVNGLYVYSNPWPLSMVQGLRVPFPADASHPAPATVMIAEVDPHTGQNVRMIPEHWFGDDPHFSVRIPAHGSVYVRVQYTQRAEAGTGSYLLTTTRPWGQPLEYGEYLLQPRGVTITGSNYQLDQPDRLSFVREQFMPDQNWRFTWRSD